MKPMAICALLSSACADAGPGLDKAKVGDLEFGIPSGWSGRDISNVQRTMWQWTPNAPENEQKESLFVIRSERPTTASQPSQLPELLRKAHQSTPNATFFPATSFITTHGMMGASIHGEFLIHGVVPYRRIHAVLIDGASLVNVIYTGLTLDVEQFNAVIDSFFKENLQ